MKTIVYKKIFKQYKIAEMRESANSEITLIFEEPIEAKLFIGKSAFSVCCGIARIPSEEVPEGEICPKLYTGTGKEEPEGFFVCHGEVVRVKSDDEISKTAAKSLIEMLGRIEHCEHAISEINGLLDRKLNF